MIFKLRIIAVLIAIFSKTFCTNAFSINVSTKDSISFVVNTFMQYNIFIGSYEVFDEDLEWIERKHRKWIAAYFERIYNEYDCTLYSKFAIAISLYKVGKKKYLIELWRKYRYLFFVDSKRSNDENVKQIWTLLDSSKVRLE